MTVLVGCLLAGWCGFNLLVIVATAVAWHRSECAVKAAAVFDAHVNDALEVQALDLATAEPIPHDDVNDELDRIHMKLWAIECGWGR